MFNSLLIQLSVDCDCWKIFMINGNQRVNMLDNLETKTIKIMLIDIAYSAVVVCLLIS